MSAQTTEKYPVVTVSNNQLTTSSKNVADVFGKNHRDVLRAIGNLETPPEFGQRNFAPSSYKNSQGKTQPAIEMTRDGFTILVMGFTGPKAMKFKLAYIDAFNKMEEELRGKAPALPAVLDTDILKTLLALSQTVESLHGKLAQLSVVEESLSHIGDMAKTMTVSIQQLSQLSRMEESLHRHIDQFRNDVVKRNEVSSQCSTADSLTLVRIEHALHAIKRLQEDVMQCMEEDVQSRGGIMGYLETYLPKHEAADVKTSSNITPDNNPDIFIKESCAVDPFASVELNFLYKVYKAWCLARFSQALGPVLFWEHAADRLPDHVTVEMRKGKKVLVGLKPAPEKLTNGN